MSRRLGIRQLELLRFVGTIGRLVVGDKRSRRLIELGLMASDNPEGDWACVTSDGLRAIADAMDAGRFPPRKPPHK